MIFTRTHTGLSNQYLFWHVGAVIFVEGGEDAYSFSQIQAGLSGSQSVDVLFWQKLFLLFLPTKKFKFRTVGSKATIRQIATDIKLGKISHVYVAMDRDHDKIKGSLIVAPGILYTYGYSWENDVFIRNVIRELFVSMCPVSLDDINFDAEIDSFYDYFSRNIRWAVYADILLSHFRIPLLPRKNPEWVIKTESDGRPAINREKIYDLIHKAKAKRHSRILIKKKISYSPCNDCFGHLISIYFYRVLIYMLKKHSKIPDLPKHYAYSAAIDQFIRQLPQPSMIVYYQHYQGLFSTLP